MEKFLLILVAMLGISLATKAQNNNRPNRDQYANQGQYNAPNYYPNRQPADPRIKSNGAYYPNAGCPQGPQNQGGVWVQVGIYNGTVNVSGGVSMPLPNNRRR